MTVKLDSIEIDIDRETEGDWIAYPDWPGVKFFVRSFEFPAYKTARDMLVQKWSRKYKGKPVPPVEMSSGFGRLYAEHILLGWEGFDVPYDAGIAAERLVDPRYRKLVAAIEWCGSQVGERETEFVEVAAKNSGQPSVTS